MSRKDLRVLVRRLIDLGWEVKTTGGNHRKLMAPSGHVLYCPTTPSDWRGGKNLLADIRRIERGRQ